MESFILSCCSTADVPFKYLEKRGIPVLFYTYNVDGVEYEDDMGRDPNALGQFYGYLKSGKLPTTSQINTQTYIDFFEEQLKKGNLLHIAFSSGQSGSVWNAFAAADELHSKYPDRKLIVVDSLCSSSGYGLLVDCAADMRDSGKSMEEIEDWLMKNRTRLHHEIFSTDLSFFRRSGRVSGTAATVGTILNICPVMRLNDKGEIKAYDKVRGKRRAIEHIVQEMKNHADNGVNYSGKCWICHSNSPEDAETLRDTIKASFPRISGEIRINDIGTIVASHCGPGTAVAFFFGDERPKME